MSAIAGIIHINNEPVSAQAGDSMMQELRKYPADNARSWYGGEVFLGCHAQWITPESVNEQLPYYDSEKCLAITADAIIDNRDELFDRLSIDRSARSGMTDSELILHAYSRWGKDSPKFIIGDFVYMIWDEKKRQLFGARDLMGNRILYYHRDQDRVAFCTTAAPLFTIPGVKKALNETWLAEYLTIPHLLDTVDSSSSVYHDIHLLPPGHSIAITDGKVNVVQYGSLVSPVGSLQLKSNGEYEEAFREVFQTAVTSKLRTFRQVGATLSGGLDSGSVAAFAARPLKQEGKTLFTYSYIPEEDYVDWTPKNRLADERPFIRETVRHVGNISDQYLDFRGKSSYSEINDWLEILEMPYKFFENSFWIKGIFEQARQQNIGVVLTGAKGNFTISWGSAYSYYVQLIRRLRWLQFYRELKSYSRRVQIGRSRLLPMLGKAFLPSLARNEETDVPFLIHPDFAARTNVIERLKDHESGLAFTAGDPLLERESYFRSLSVLSMQGTIASKLSLRHGLVERDPTCDPRVVRFCLSLPLEQFVQNGVDRALIRRSAKGYLPDSVRLNQRTRGIQGADSIHRLLPVWREFMDEARRMCSDTNIQSILNVDQIRGYMDQFGEVPLPEQTFGPEIRFLMRSLIFYRFMKGIAS